MVREMIAVTLYQSDRFVKRFFYRVPANFEMWILAILGAITTVRIMLEDHSDVEEDPRKFMSVISQ